ncbi:hypothetical protein [Asticcacaulis sp. EMRT-3]|nr:hypothetical protein [Asticcacaulis sp. EMRT-3]MDI7775305.1 hypothetical protein [Asticcacaulis sp. EMRT-3]
MRPASPSLNSSSRPVTGQTAKQGRDVRSLANLGDTASTSRVLNLSQI